MSAVAAAIPVAVSAPKAAAPCAIALPSRRALNLGPGLCKVSDEILMNMLEFLQEKDLLTLGECSPVLYLLCNEEPLWRQICHLKHGFAFKFAKTWKATALGREHPQIAVGGFSSDFLYRRWFRGHVDLSTFLPEDDGLYIEKRSITTVTIDDFQRCYEQPRRLLMLTGLEKLDGWACYTDSGRKWTVSNFLRRFPSKMRFDISHTVDKSGFSHDDDDGDDACSGRIGSSLMSMQQYVDYCKQQHDETPHYVFEPRFGEKDPTMLDDYTVPKIFTDDFFSAFGKRSRPNFRWLVMGPARSGAPWHIDPTCTSAWNALLVGRKRWAFYPPGTVPPGVSVDWGDDDATTEHGGKYGNMKGTSMATDGHMPDDVGTPTSLVWYLEVYPTLSKEQRPIEIIQNPGDVIYVPHGWWHMVLNLDMTIAVTQNYAGRHNLCRALDDIYASEGPRALMRAKTRIERKYPSVRRSLDLYMLPFEEGFSSEVERLASFRDVSTWGPIIEKVMKAHGLEYERIDAPCCKKCNRAVNEYENVEPMSVRANPIFGVGSTVVKLFSHYHSGEFQRYAILSDNMMMCGGGELTFQVELTVCLAINRIRESGAHNVDFLPSMIARGRLHATDASTWRYPYILLKRIVDSESYASARRKNSSVPAQSGVAAWLGQKVRAIHSFIDADTINKAVHAHGFLHAHVEFDASKFPLRSDWSWYLSFLDSQLRSCAGALWRWHMAIGISRDLLSTLDAYLPKSSADLAPPMHGAPKTLHGDLQPENILGRADEGGVWMPGAIIDFGDAKAGDPLYDLVALVSATFRCDRAMLRAFMLAYGDDADREHAGFTMDEEFLKRAMCLTILHPCNALRCVYMYCEEAKSCESWDSLARMIWCWWE